MRLMALQPQDLSWSMAHQEGYKDSTRQEETAQNGTGDQNQTQQENLDTTQLQPQKEKIYRKTKKYGETKLG